jgi:tetratricopeptide (TPR) repeat protein
VLNLDPEFPWAYHNRGVAHHLKGSLKAAIDDYDEALKRKASNALVYNNLALAKRQLGDLPGADFDAKESLSLDPQYAPAYYNRATILDSTGDKQAAAHYKHEGAILTVPSKGSPLDRETANH